MLDNKVIEKVDVSHFPDILIKYLNHLNEIIKIDFVIIYGSYVRGLQKPWSDIDLLIISEDFQNKEQYFIKKILLCPILKYSIPKISPIGLSLDRWKTKSYSEFIKVVLKTGKLLEFKYENNPKF